MIDFAQKTNYNICMKWGNKTLETKQGTQPDPNKGDIKEVGV